MNRNQERTARQTLDKKSVSITTESVPIPPTIQKKVLAALAERGLIKDGRVIRLVLDTSTASPRI